MWRSMGSSEVLPPAASPESSGPHGSALALLRHGSFAAFLVSREMEQAFDSRVKEIGQQYDKLTFKYTGPWPPYNFVNIRLKLERAH